MDKRTPPSHIPCSDLVSQTPLIKARGTPGKSSQQGIPVGSSGVGLILVAVLIPNVPDRLH